ncbi:MAG: OadG family protein [Oscillospiraceae bacterium]|nr:OadG family protein [Oscillospiraceae bacterium]
MSFNYELIRNIDWFKYMSLSDAGTKIIVGFTVVFIGLILLVTIFSIMGLIFKSVSKSSAKKEEKKKAKTDKKGSEKKTVVTEKKEESVAPVPVVEDGISDDVVAVIAAAIASMSDGETRYAVRSIKKTRNIGGRPAWAMAGIRENTSSF